MSTKRRVWTGRRHTRHRHPATPNWMLQLFRRHSRCLEHSKGTVRPHRCQLRDLPGRRYLSSEKPASDAPSLVRTRRILTAHVVQGTSIYSEENPLQRTIGRRCAFKSADTPGLRFRKICRCASSTRAMSYSVRTRQARFEGPVSSDDTLDPCWRSPRTVLLWIRFEELQPQSQERWNLRRHKEP